MFSTIMSRMLPSERLELAIYQAIKHVPGPRSIRHCRCFLRSPAKRTTAQLQNVSKTWRMKVEYICQNIQVVKFGLAVIRLTAPFSMQDHFVIEIAARGRKYFEELEQRAEDEARQPTPSPRAEPLIFVSCGQSTPAERQLGQAIAKLVERRRVVGPILPRIKTHLRV